VYMVHLVPPGFRAWWDEDLVGTVIVPAREGPAPARLGFVLVTLGSGRKVWVNPRHIDFMTPAGEESAS
jgi:hypothetical protein